MGNPFLEEIKGSSKKSGSNPFLEEVKAKNEFMDLSPPPASTDLLDEAKAFGSGAMQGASYNQSRLNKNIRESADKLKESSPTSFSGGENFGAMLSSLLPIAPEAIAVKGIAPLVRPLTNAGSRIANAVASGIKGATGAVIGQGARDLEPVLNEGKEFNPQEYILPAAISTGLGSGVGALRGSASRAKAVTKAEDVLNRAIPEDPEAIQQRQYIEEAKKLGVPEEDIRYLSEKSSTPRILRENIKGKNAAQLQVKADVRSKQIEDELQPILKQLKSNPEFQYDPGRIQQEFYEKFGDESLKQINDVPGAVRNYRYAVSKNFDDFLDPETMNIKKRDLYKRLTDKAFQNETNLGPVQKARKDMAIFLKNKIEEIGNTVEPGIGDKIKELNSRSAAMIDYFDRLKNVKNPSLSTSVSRGARKGFWNAALMSPAAAVFPDEAKYVLPAVGIGTGAAAGLSDYLSQKPGFAASKANRLYKFGTGSPENNSLIQALSALSERKGK